MSSSGPPAVCLDHVWKRYLLGQGGALASLRGAIRPGTSAREAHWSLKDLSLEVRPGESVGLVGHNGAGKTTALKLIAGITRPSRGAVRTRGRVASLLNVGAGFHRDLTGRENVTLNGVILGLTRREVARRYDQIVEFAGLGPHMDTPVKRYSAGMFTRLAFAVAAHVDSDILLVDEVLSVGDAAFQDRSLRRMLRFRDSGAAVVFVSHNLDAVALMCQRVVWLHQGEPRACGPADETLRTYLDQTDETQGDVSASGPAAIEVQAVDVLDLQGEARSGLAPDEAFTVRVRATALVELRAPAFILTVRGDRGPLFTANMLIDGQWPPLVAPGPFSAACTFDSPRLEPGAYRVELKVKQNVRTNYFEPRVLARFSVGRAEQRGSLLAVPHEWRTVSDIAPLGTAERAPGAAAGSGAGAGAGAS